MHILVIYTGGASFLAGKPADQIEKTLKSYLELQLVSDTTVKIMDNRSGADATWDTAVHLGECVNEHYATYDGFVVVHGVDNALAIANLFTFLFAALGKPVIFTGCPLSDDAAHVPEQLSDEQRLYREMGLRTNLITAVQLATLNCAGTLLAYGAHAIRAVRAIETGDDAQSFQSWHEADAAEVQFGIHLSPTAPVRHTKPIGFGPAFSRDIYIAYPYPEMTLPSDVEQRYRAVILSGYRDQILPSTLKLPHTIPVIIHTKPRQNFQSDTPALLVPNATFPVLLTKTMATVGQTTTVQQFMKEFQKNRFGEFY